MAVVPKLLLLALYAPLLVSCIRHHELSPRYVPTWNASSTLNSSSAQSMSDTTESPEKTASRSSNSDSTFQTQLVVPKAHTTNISSVEPVACTTICSGKSRSQESTTGNNSINRSIESALLPSTVGTSLQADRWIVNVTIVGSSANFTQPTATFAQITTLNTTICPTTSYPTNIPISWRTFPNACSEDDELIATPWWYSYSDRCLATYCADSYSSAVIAYSATGPFTDFVTSTTEFIPQIIKTISGRRWVFKESYTTTQVETFEKALYQYVTISSPCCGQCTLHAPTIHFYFWPDQTAADSPATAESFIDESGYTFISPSVYIAFTSLWASDYCGTVNNEVITSTTLAFDLSEISTFGEPDWITCENMTAMKTQLWNDRILGGTWDPDVEFGTDWWEYRPPQQLTISDLVQNCSALPSTCTDSEEWTCFMIPYQWNPDDPENEWITDDPCHPYISIPSRIKGLRPGWAPCTPDSTMSGFFDPPRTLHPGVKLVPTTTPASKLLSVDATPGDLPVVTPPTPTANPKRPENSPSFFSVALPASGTLDTPIAAPSDTGDPMTQVVATSQHLQLTLAGTTFTGDAESKFSIRGQTLAPGSIITIGGVKDTLPNGALTLVGGTQISLDPSATKAIIVFNGITSTIAVGSAPAIPTSTSPPQRVYTPPGASWGYTIDAFGRIIISTRTLYPGSALVVGGTTIIQGDGRLSVKSGTLVALATDRANMVVGGQTITLPGFHTTTSSIVLPTEEPGSALYQAVESTTTGLSAAAEPSRESKPNEPLSTGGTSSSPVFLGTGVRQGLCEWWYISISIASAVVFSYL